MIIRSTERIATLALTSVVMDVLTAGMMRAPEFGQTSQVDNAERLVGRGTIVVEKSPLHLPRGRKAVCAYMISSWRGRTTSKASK
jgi:hypothetical protein